MRNDFSIKDEVNRRIFCQKFINLSFYLTADFKYVNQKKYLFILDIELFIYFQELGMKRLVDTT